MNVDSFRVLISEVTPSGVHIPPSVSRALTISQRLYMSYGDGNITRDHSFAGDREEPLLSRNFIFVTNLPRRKPYKISPWYKAFSIYNRSTTKENKNTE